MIGRPRGQRKHKAKAPVISISGSNIQDGTVERADLDPELIENFTTGIGTWADVSLSEDSGNSVGSVAPLATVGGIELGIDTPYLSNWRLFPAAPDTRFVITIHGDVQFDEVLEEFAHPSLAFHLPEDPESGIIITATPHAEGNAAGLQLIKLPGIPGSGHWIQCPVM